MYPTWEGKWCWPLACYRVSTSEKVHKVDRQAPGSNTLLTHGILLFTKHVQLQRVPLKCMPVSASREALCTYIYIADIYCKMRGTACYDKVACIKHAATSIRCALQSMTLKTVVYYFKYLA